MILCLIWYKVHIFRYPDIWEYAHIRPWKFPIWPMRWLLEKFYIHHTEWYRSEQLDTMIKVSTQQSWGPFIPAVRSLERDPFPWQSLLLILDKSFTHPYCLHVSSCNGYFPIINRVWYLFWFMKSVGWLCIERSYWWNAYLQLWKAVVCAWNFLQLAPSAM